MEPQCSLPSASPSPPIWVNYNSIRSGKLTWISWNMDLFDGVFPVPIEFHGMVYINQHLPQKKCSQVSIHPPYINIPNKEAGLPERKKRPPTLDRPTPTGAYPNIPGFPPQLRGRLGPPRHHPVAPRRFHCVQLPWPWPR